MDTILVPVDFSAASRTASVYAASFARLAKAKIILFHAYLLPTPVSEVPYVMVPVNEMQTEHEQMIRNEAEVLHRNFDIEVISLVQIGLPADEITATAADHGASLIVVGMRGAGSLDKLIGSTAASVMRKAKCPVLVVPHNTIFNPVEHIVYASDFSYSLSAAMFRPVLEIVNLFGSEVHIVHVRKLEAPQGAGTDAAAKTGISAVLGTAKHSFTILHDDSINHGINDYVTNHNVQLLVMVAHKHNFFERLFNRHHTTEMAYQTRVPLLVLHG
jgi:nucleotide-binding universal stress UspA family protein